MSVYIVWSIPRIFCFPILCFGAVIVVRVSCSLKMTWKSQFHWLTTCSHIFSLKHYFTGSKLGSAYQNPWIGSSFSIWFSGPSEVCIWNLEDAFWYFPTTPFLWPQPSAVFPSWSVVICVRIGTSPHLCCMRISSATELKRRNGGRMKWQWAGKVGHFFLLLLSGKVH